VIAALILGLGLGADPNEMTLRSSVSSGDKPEIGFVSVQRPVDGGRWYFVLSESVTNYVPRFALHFKVGEAKGIVPAAKGGPKVMTMVRNTYRFPRQIFGQFDHRYPAQDDFEGTFTSNRWDEGKGRYPAYAGGRLGARLIEGDEKGKVLARFASEVSRDSAAGYVYAYVVENLTDRPLKFKWAGLEGSVEPKKTFAKKETTTKLSEEESGTASLDFSDGREFVIHANLWARSR